MAENDFRSVETEESLTPAAIRALVANHREFLAFLERRVGSKDIAEDILQEAFVRGMDKADAIKNEESAIAWFYRLLRNAVIDHHRRNASAAKRLENFAIELKSQELPDQELRGTICKCVSELAGTLKPEYSEALRRVELEGLQVKDYAAELGITSANAGVRIFRAREALRKQVARSCGTCADHGCLDCTCDKSAAGCGASS
jgi:RNA polymerase sigma-70 factor (ECF subfamily)